MKENIHVIQADGKDSSLPRSDVLQALGHMRNALVVTFTSASDLTVGRGVLRNLPRLLEEKRAARQQERIEKMMEGLLDLDPFDQAETRIDADNAALRTRFLEDFKTLTSAEVHANVGHKGRNTAQTAATWKRAGRICSVTYGGRDLFPAFQFDSGGQPLPLLKDVLAALPGTLTSWQRAFWLVARDFHLDGKRPIDCIREGDPGVIEAARHAGALPVG
ncbi:hypothetical protein U879_18710 [Defluviimonas sp. 20V17]|uniref:Antitoxin Xre/MbcA/ParS-like toxin-binding domain-containing protein n=1 Tax=Allgaiera indica TaxID=765699 RepID=A0AAN4URU8_9RHOB|nr:hypothetical protein [Allgaiera indica]KDB02167.1 hypothetical protein U879_18710 [Defluviimonas sp. 20V17]GHE02620.1 hypothetical protein GCM10008024_22890 [Allgaiera indica]SDX20138.1 hypothetical protein SAMN05444006_111137 [Allgaiera indica]